MVPFSYPSLPKGSFSFPSFSIPATRRKGTVEKSAIFVYFLLILYLSLLFFPFTSPMPIPQLCLASHFYERLTRSLLRCCLTLNKTQIHSWGLRCRPLTSDAVVRPPVLTFPTSFCMAGADPTLTVTVVLHSPASCSFLRSTTVSPSCSPCCRTYISMLEDHNSVWRTEMDYQRLGERRPLEMNSYETIFTNLRPASRR